MKRPSCLVPGCPRPQKSRGLCDTCLANYRRALREERITEERAIELGLLLPKKQRGPSRSSKFDLALLTAATTAETLRSEKRAHARR